MLTTSQKVQGYLQDTLRFFRANIGSLALLALPYAVLSEAFQLFVLSSAKGPNLVGMSLMAELTLYPIFQSALIIFIGSAISGNIRPFGQCYSISAAYWPRMLLLTLLSTIATMGGFFLFIVPGLFIMVRLALSDMFCMVENRSVADSIRLSVAASQKVSWVIFLGLALLFPTVTIISIGLSQATASIANPVLGFMVAAVQALLNTLYSIYLFRVFSDVRSQ
ncbi:hypothetical protein M3P05_16765 [Sansalvadorimonas sp. 2012CJ34-2]|uniref:Glycerophosphoryl diester phosphodiesterase membrane domain-containing protein n=1 Tax=Parendozoicomonas callyspongiae TaxID=2942213 RepID=A0ABT0PJK3_9GAMM|nr:YciC family protein [Sansalvadorimonas sp. 2012CJ34-2]MCL6271570.1 hypothetical protein [Sansalvadorimonas sp. 2012CJ34-2]